MVRLVWTFVSLLLHSSPNMTRERGADSGPACNNGSIGDSELPPVQLTDRLNYDTNVHL